MPSEPRSRHRPPDPSKRRRPPPQPSARSQRAFDWLNFFIADVETAFGPFIAAYLTIAGWQQGAIGTIITVNAVVALAVQIPAGWAVDRIHSKRFFVVVCLGCIAGGSLLIALFPNFIVVAAGEALHGITGGAIRTAIAAIALGLVGHRALHTRVGRNHRYSAFGNAATAAGMGALGQFVSPSAPFFAAAGLCVPAAAVLMLIRRREIHYGRARQAPPDDERRAARWRSILSHRVILVFAAALFLFQFANASVVPLATERMTAHFRPVSEAVTSAMIIVPEVVTALLAAWVARKADEWGRRWMLLIAFAALLARAILFAPALGPWYLVAIQLLSGVDAVVLGILTPLVIADCTRHTGLYNFTFGVAGMLSGIGAALSTAVTGLIAETFGFTTAFLTLAGVAAGAVAVVWFLLPETVQASREED